MTPKRHPKKRKPQPNPWPLSLIRDLIKTVKTEFNINRKKG